MISNQKKELESDICSTNLEKNYLILAHTNPDQLKQLTDRLDDEGTRFYIHLDLNIDIAPFREKINIPNVVFIKEREKCYWGDISLVKATLHCMRAVLDDQRKGHCILLSGQDYPIRTNADINDFLTRNAEYDFVDIKPIQEQWPEDGWRYRVEEYKFDLSTEKADLLVVPSVYSLSFYNKSTFNKLSKLSRKKIPYLRQVLKKREFPEYLKCYGGPQWWALKVETVEKVIHFVDEHEDYLEYHQFCFCPDEFFFHSILQNLSESEQIKIKPSITFVNWVSKIDVSPEVFKQSDLAKILLKAPHHLFARKFDINIDSEIFNKIDTFNTSTSEIKIKTMHEVLCAESIIKPDHDLVTVNEHTFINTLNYQSTVVDLGGNKGGFSKLALKLFYCKQLYIVEGNPRMIPVIEKNLEEFDDKVEIINALIGPAYSKDIDFHICEDSEASMIDKSLNKGQKILETVKVEMISMNEIYERVGDQKIDLLKVDVEGMEWEILNKFTAEDFDKIDQIAVEFHDFLDKSKRHKTEEVIQHMESLGYIFVKGMYQIWADYYDCLFCKPELFARYSKQKEENPRPGNRLSINQQYIFKEQEIISLQNQHKKDIDAIHQSLSWKLTAPIRKLGDLIGYG